MEFGFTKSLLNFNKVSKNDTVTKTAVFEILNPNELEIGNITTTSPHIRARRVEAHLEGGSQIQIEVTLSPGLPVGLIIESVVVEPNPAIKPAAKLYIRGVIEEGGEADPSRP